MKLRKVVTGLCVGALAIGATALPVMAEPAEVTLTETVDVTGMGTAIVLYGGAALAVAFSIGGGFRIAKKAYSWLFSKI